MNKRQAKKIVKACFSNLAVRMRCEFKILGVYAKKRRWVFKVLTRMGLDGQDLHVRRLEVMSRDLLTGERVAFYRLMDWHGYRK